MLHPSAIIETKHIGQGTKVWANTHICQGAKIGKNCTIGENVYIGKNVIIGDECKIQNGALIYEGVEIGNYVFIGPAVCTTNDFCPTLKELDWAHRFKKTIIEDYASIGANSTIICGIKIARGSMIGAGSVLTRSTIENGVYYGNPARQKK